ncbi:hypothetical protein HK102_013450 [Quaeritorhiza haematococci]|nr:hypothetical protein HK102_013450 [Quaeritorhiza haematococci]
MAGSRITMEPTPAGKWGFRSLRSASTVRIIVIILSIALVLITLTVSPEQHGLHGGANSQLVSAAVSPNPRLGGTLTATIFEREAMSTGSGEEICHHAVKIHGCSDTPRMFAQKLFSISCCIATLTLVFITHLISRFKHIGEHVNDMNKFKGKWVAPVLSLEVVYESLVAAGMPIPFCLLADVFYATAGIMFILEMIGKTMVINDFAATLGQTNPSQSFQSGAWITSILSSRLKRTIYLQSLMFTSMLIPAILSFFAVTEMDQLRFLYYRDIAVWASGLIPIASWVLLANATGRFLNGVAAKHQRRIEKMKMAGGKAAAANKELKELNEQITKEANKLEKIREFQTFLRTVAIWTMIQHSVQLYDFIAFDQVLRDPKFRILGYVMKGFFNTLQLCEGIVMFPWKPVLGMKSKIAVKQESKTGLAATGKKSGAAKGTAGAFAAGSAKTTANAGTQDDGDGAGVHNGKALADHMVVTVSGYVTGMVDTLA